MLPEHPEKVLAVSQRWARQRPHTLRGLVRAILRACAYCEDPANQRALAATLAKAAYIGQPAEVIEESLGLGAGTVGGGWYRPGRPAGWRMRSFAPGSTFPSKLHPAWIMTQMIRWGQMSPAADVMDLAARCCMTEPYRQAAASLGLACPGDDFPGMPLRNGEEFDVTSLSAAALGAARREAVAGIVGGVSGVQKGPAKKVVLRVQ